MHVSSRAYKDARRQTEQGAKRPAVKPARVQLVIRMQLHGKNCELNLA
jgi:hypothetical protein